jgi:hypothetical protein
MVLKGRGYGGVGVCGAASGALVQMRATDGATGSRSLVYPSHDDGQACVMGWALLLML